MEDSVSRKERLRAIRAAASAKSENAGEDVESEAPVLKFRNYAPRDEKHIAHEKVDPANPPEFEEPRADEPSTDAADEQAETVINVAPKKANWDLKRAIQPKLEKLERRTARALVELLRQQEREQLEKEGGVADTAAEAAADTRA